MFGLKLLKPEDRSKLFELFHEYGLKPPRIIVTKGEYINAFGGFPFAIVISAGLLKVVNDEELFAVILHEIGHKKLSSGIYKAYWYYFISLYLYLTSSYFC